MFNSILLSVSLIREAIDQKALRELIHDQIFFSRVVIPVTIDLTTLNDQRMPFQNSDYRFLELNFEDLRDRKYNFSIRSRYFKALRNLKNGLRGFVLLKENTVIGDIWCVAPQSRDAPIRHPDLDMLGITSVKGDGYAVDIFMDPAYRGKKLAMPVHKSLEMILKSEGWHRLYGWVYEDNISSKWLHIMLKFKELPKLRAFRFFFIRNTYKYIPTKPSI